MYLVDAAGARIDEQFDSYAGRHAWGNIFYNQVQYSGRVPQVCALFGPSPAGSAYVPACATTIMVRGHATAYLGSPRLAEMVTGEHVTLEDMGGAEMHCRVSGLGDCWSRTTRRPSPRCGCGCRTSRRPGRRSRRLTAGWAPAATGPSRRSSRSGRTSPSTSLELIEAVVDEGTFFPYKELFAPELVDRVRPPRRRSRSASSPTSRSTRPACCSPTRPTRRPASSGSATPSTSRCCSCATSPAT